MLKIEFSTENDTFSLFKEEECTTILQRIALQVSQGVVSAPVHDSNGNKIGEWSLS